MSRKPAAPLFEAYSGAVSGRFGVWRDMGCRAGVPGRASPSFYQFDRDIPGKLDKKVAISDMKMPEMVITDRELAVVARRTPAARPEPAVKINLS